jgi:hypothetical protein
MRELQFVRQRPHVMAQASMQALRTDRLHAMHHRFV